MDVTCQQGTITLLDYWFRPFLGLAYALIVETSFLEPVVCLYNILRHFLDFACILNTHPANITVNNLWSVIICVTHVICIYDVKLKEAQNKLIKFKVINIVIIDMVFVQLLITLILPVKQYQCQYLDEHLSI